MPTEVCVLTSVHQPFDGRIFHRECRSLAQAGYQVTLIAPTELEPQERDGIALVGVKPAVSRWQRPLVWWRLYRHVLRLRPQVVHFHDPELLLLVPLLRLALGRRSKIIYDVHEYFLDSLASKHWIPAWLRPAGEVRCEWLERLLLHGIDGIILVVEGQKPLYTNFRGPVAVVRNLPLSQLFADPQPHPALDVEGFKLLYVGLILPERGINILLEALDLLHTQGIRDVYLFLIGPDTSPAYMQEIETFARSHELSDQVRLLGYILHDQIKHYLANAHVGLLPGLPTRQFRNPAIATKLLEYMLSELPILGVDHAHHRVFVEEADCGLLVPFADPAAHAEAILWLREHPEQARAMGQRGRALILERYTWEMEQDRLLEFYQDLLEESGSTASEQVRSP